MNAAVDHLQYNRQTVAAALRRLSDAALVAAEVFSDADAAADESDAMRVVRGRQLSVEHALVIVEATRTGLRRAAEGRVA